MLIISDPHAAPGTGVENTLSLALLLTADPEARLNVSLNHRRPVGVKGGNAHLIIVVLLCCM